MNYECILLDIEVQRDFFAAGGSCYAKEASRCAAKIYELFDWAKTNDIPIISTVLRLRQGKQGPLCDVPHCLEGTDGEHKLAKTVLHKRANLGLRNTTDLPTELFSEYKQVIFEKRDTDIFTHARAERLISQLAGGTFIICGAGLAHGIVEAAVGLRKRGFAVIVASDAVLDLADRAAKMARLRMEAKGVIFLPTRKIIRTSQPSKRRSLKPSRLTGRPILQR